MFRLLDSSVSELVEIELDGEMVAVPGGVSVAAAMLFLDAVPTRRTPVSGEARAPFCMMGVCFECLLEIDDNPNRRACQVEVVAGMRIRRQGGAADSEPAL